MSLNKQLKNRIIKHIKSDNPGPIIVFFGGVHGNEKAGVVALSNVLSLVSKHILNGEVYGIKGNIKGLESNNRFIDTDLNRLWTTSAIKQLKDVTLNSEQKEQKELLKVIKAIMRETKSSIYFIDLHTTSSTTPPFITINDAMINRKFAQWFNIPVVLGIEEYLDGPLLSYLNSVGFVSLGFEAGQHDDPTSIISCESFIHLTLFFAGVIGHSIKIENSKKQLEKATVGLSSFYEVIHKHHIQASEHFKMQPGYKSFQDVKKGQLIAFSNGKKVVSKQRAKLFMPLYQKRGQDGFFLIKQTSNFFLRLSDILRKLRSDSLLTILPGVSWHNKANGVLVANLKTTRFLAKDIFHLFGYRNKQISGDKALLYNRERSAKTNMYKNEWWYKKRNPIER